VVVKQKDKFNQELYTYDASFWVVKIFLAN